MTTDDAVALSAVAAAISALAALISLVALAVSVYLQWRASQPRVQVEGTYSTIYQGDRVHPTTFCITVRNVGTIPVTITGVGVWQGQQRGALISARTADDRTPPIRMEAGEGADLTNLLGPAVEAHRSSRITGV